MDIVSVLLGWTLWFGATAVILRVDAARQRAAVEARGEVDFVDFIRRNWARGSLPLGVVGSGG